MTKRSEQNLYTAGGRRTRSIGLRRRAATLALAVLALVSVGASCGSKGDPAPAGEPGGSAPVAAVTSKPVEAVPGVDVSVLTHGERALWQELVNELLSPCGEPISVGRCAADGQACGKCRTATRYVARLVAQGFQRSEIEAMYRGRYAPGGQVDFDLKGAPTRGAAMAPVTIVEFSDFECPYCGRAHGLFASVLREFQGKVRLVFLNYPLSGHPHAFSAARAAVAAGKQGKFWEMHDMLFEHQTALEESDLKRYAKLVGLDVARFEADYAAPETQAQVEADRALGDKVGVQGTPTVFVNGRRFEESPQTLADYLREELEP